MSDSNQLLTLVATDWYTVTGRGQIAAVDLRQIPDCPPRINTEADIPLSVSQHVTITGHGTYEIRGIEYARGLVSPPFIRPTVCLQLRSTTTIATITKPEPCKHCPDRIALTTRSADHIHVEGDQMGKHTCAVNPYGFHAEPVGTPCGKHPSNPCNGSRGIEPTPRPRVPGEPVNLGGSPVTQAGVPRRARYSTAIAHNGVIKVLVAMLVPTKWVIRLAMITAPTPEDRLNPLITEVPDTWLPPFWIRNDRLGDGHPNKKRGPQ